MWRYLPYCHLPLCEAYISLDFLSLLTLNSNKQLVWFMFCVQVDILCSSLHLRLLTFIGLLTFSVCVHIQCINTNYPFQCREVTMIVKLVIINITQHTPQTKVSDTIMHVTLNTINDVVEFEDNKLKFKTSCLYPFFNGNLENIPPNY